MLIRILTGLVFGALLVAQPQPCSIEGQVVEAANGDGLKDVQVWFERVESGPPPPTLYYTRTANDGTYRVVGLQPGRYYIQASRSGFARAIFGAKNSARGGTAVTVDTGEKITGVDFKLKRAGVVAGMVLDIDGDPMPDAPVTLMQISYRNGQPEFQPVAMYRGRRTNDLGQYRFFDLEPGRYYVSAGSPPGSELARLGEDRSVDPRPGEWRLSFQARGVAGVAPFRVPSVTSPASPAIGRECGAPDTANAEEDSPWR